MCICVYIHWFLSQDVPFYLQALACDPHQTPAARALTCLLQPHPVPCLHSARPGGKRNRSRDMWFAQSIYIYIFLHIHMWMQRWMPQHMVYMHPDCWCQPQIRCQLMSWCLQRWRSSGPSSSLREQKKPSQGASLSSSPPLPAAR